MSRKFIFADESGNFDFTRNPGASKYFILTTLTATDCIVGQALLDLRRTLAWEGVGLNSEFHATADLQAIRDRVFQAISPIEFRLDTTILEKCKAQPSIRNTPEHFYKIAWYLHTKYVVPQIVLCSQGRANHKEFIPRLEAAYALPRRCGRCNSAGNPDDAVSRCQLGVFK